MFLLFSGQLIDTFSLVAEKLECIRRQPSLGTFSLLLLFLPCNRIFLCIGNAKRTYFFAYTFPREECDMNFNTKDIRFFS